jgi:signal transduction histidine kinase
MSELASARQLRRLLDAVVALNADVGLPVLLRHLVEAGQELVGARSAALGVHDPDHTHLAQLITAGSGDPGTATIDTRPAGNGVLSVPITVQGEVFGNLCFADKIDGPVFTAIDEELAVALAASTAVAIENVRLHERTRELSLLADRERLSLELHDTVIQQIFGTGLALHTTARLSREPAVRDRILAHVDALDEVVRQLRLAIFELDVSPGVMVDVRHEILAVSADAARSLGFSPALRMRGPIESLGDDPAGVQLGAVLREALSNVARHSRAAQVEISVTLDAGVLNVRVEDDGIGVAADAPRGDGLENIFRRAERLGGSAAVGPGAAGGTALTWSVPVGRPLDPLGPGCGDAP